MMEIGRVGISISDNTAHIGKINISLSQASHWEVFLGPLEGLISANLMLYFAEINFNSFTS